MHCVYFLAFDQIGHHLVIETYQGLAHDFNRTLEGDESVWEVKRLVVGGYTAGEWAALEPAKSWDMGCNYTVYTNRTSAMGRRTRIGLH